MRQIILLSKPLIGRALTTTTNPAGVTAVLRYRANQLMRLSDSASMRLISATPYISSALRSHRNLIQRQTPELRLQNYPLNGTTSFGSRYLSSTQRLFNNEETKAKPTPGAKLNTKSRSPKKTALLLALLTVTAALYLALPSTTEDGHPRNIPLEYLVGKPLNTASFVPFTIVSRTQVSPTSFIITVRPKHARDPSTTTTTATATGSSWPWLPDFLSAPHANIPILQRAWDYGLWAVEIKQPQLQVAREYTPLPSAYGEEAADLERGHLRFLIRTVEGGEVSTYLSRLGVGDEVELRGPHLGFDVVRRLGMGTTVGDEEGVGEQKKKKVVFLAGGTGIAPALQVVRRVLDGNGNGDERGAEVGVEIVWANRRRADCEGCEALEGMLKGLRKGGEEGSSNNPVLSLLAEARERHGDNVKYVCTVDEEGSFISGKAIAGMTGLSSFPSSTTSNGTFSFWTRKDTPPKAAPSQEKADNSSSCPYHSITRLITSDSSDDSALSTSKTDKADTRTCQCHPEGGKNLLMVSGPDGFISAFVGPKVWANGKELQGPVRGIVGGELKRKTSEFWKGWLVLKL